jgi:hypothetical protein
MMNELPPDSKLRRNIDFVSLLCKHSKSPKKRQHLLSVATPEQIDACAELYLNLLKGNIKLPKEDLKKLERYKEHIRTLSNRKTPRGKKKLLLGTQSGGFLPLLIPAIAPLVIKALQGIFQ